MEHKVHWFGKSAWVVPDLTFGTFKNTTVFELKAKPLSGEHRDAPLSTLKDRNSRQREGTLYFFFHVCPKPV